MTPESLRALATLIDVNGSVRSALIGWADEAAPADAAAVRAVGSLVRLGVPPEEACATVWRSGGNDLGAILGRGESWGGPVGRSVSRYADRVEEERAALASREVSVVGAKLSARIVVAVPVIAFFWGVARRGMEGPTLALALMGALLVGAGAVWMARLKPAVSDRLVIRLASELADAVEGGMHPEPVISRLARRPEYGQLLTDVRVAVAGGALWAQALSRADDPDLRHVGRLCWLSHRQGRPLAPSLRASAREMGRRRALALDRAIRRAPIQLVIPLTTCVLPGSLLVAAAPLLT